MTMANMSLTKNPMPSQDPEVRNKNFSEVALGYTEEQALDEAQRCLHCKNKPCMTGCPVMVHIPEFIEEVAKATSRLPIRSSPPPRPCPPSAAASAPRRASARSTASGARRASP
jgi:Fe-S oxidoreductase